MLLSGFLDKELDAQDAELLQNHIKSCKECASELGYQRKIKHILQARKAGLSAQEAQPLPFFETRLLNRISTSNARGFNFDEFILPAKRTALAGSFILLLAFIGLWLSGTGSEKITVEEYLLENTASTVEKKIYTEAEISQDDIISLASNYDQEDL
ncbi:MAG: hypothetical protein A2252_04130 [Elusimicrobia bacterium RIFOXYA2_FULL_39_19]|nr:MAG: hypothetical protein A2252_04130 [Elusimicrobia bacterium RIFOXYA2_FULL_39_19]